MLIFKILVGVFFLILAYNVINYCIMFVKYGVEGVKEQRACEKKCLENDFAERKAKKELEKARYEWDEHWTKQEECYFQ